MPPSDPRLNPALEPSRPGDVRAGTTRPCYPEPWSFRFGGKQEDEQENWRDVSVRARATDKQGRAIVQIEWRAAGSTWGGSFVADETMRPRW